jgi:hypothetical protein
VIQHVRHMLTLTLEWVSGDLNAVAQWDTAEADDISYHRVWKQNQQLFSEVNDRAEWGNIVGTIFHNSAP